MAPEGGDRRGDKEREVILLGILNIESVYGKEWVKKKKEVKKDLQSKSVMLNQAFKNPHIFHERFEFLSADDYSCVKNNYIYSAIVIFNPNLGGNSSGGEEPVPEGGHMGEDAPAGQAKVKNTCVVSGGQHTRHAAQGGAASLCGGSTSRQEKKEGVGVLVVTCKKTDSEKMKNILVKMLKKEIRVECTALKCKDGHFSSLSHVRREERDVRGKHTEIRYLDRPPASPAAVHSREQSREQSSVQSGVQSSVQSGVQSTLQSTLQCASPPAPSAANKPFNVSRNNFFNMTAYIYGSSNLLANSSLILREYGDDEWAERLRRTKKGKEQARGGPPPHTGAHDVSEPREGGLIKTFTSLFKK